MHVNVIHTYMHYSITMFDTIILFAGCVDKPNSSLFLQVCTGLTPMEAATQTASKFTVTLKMAAAPRVSTPPIWYVLSVVLDFLMMIVIAVFLQYTVYKHYCLFPRILH